MSKTNASRRGGRYSYAKAESQWKAYERLPRSVRKALSEGAFCWAPYPIWRWWNAGRYKTAEDLVRAIKKWNANAHKRDAKKDRWIIPQTDVQ